MAVRRVTIRHHQKTRFQNQLHLLLHYLSVLSQWSKVVGISRVLSFVCRTIIWCTLTYGFLLCLLIGYLLELLLDRVYVNQASDLKDERKWLTGYAINTLVDERKLRELFDAALIREENDHDGLKLDEVKFESNSNILSRYISRSYSKVEHERVKIFKTSAGTTPISLSRYFVFAQIDSTETFENILSSFELNLIKFKELTKFDIPKLLASFPKLERIYLFFSRLPLLVEIFSLALRKTLSRRVKFPLFKKRSTSNGSEKSIAWTNLIPSEVIEKLEEFTSFSKDAISMSIITIALQSYCQTISGTIPRDFYALVLDHESIDGSLIGAHFKIPITMDYDTKELMTRASLRFTKTKSDADKYRTAWRLIREVLPINLCKIIKRCFYSRNSIAIQNIHLENSSSSSPFTTLIEAVYHWCPLPNRVHLSITVTFLPTGVTFSIMANKDNFQSTTLLAECIEKAISQLCVVYGVHWNRRSPPSTPTNCRDI